ncbi:hypothetical protein BJ165DRAFT_756569 [Panaeolus papilionaceus]|nr:hypothetical protein BJ165DRAFT_756569 [Panaeolus papilionaceus]
MLDLTPLITPPSTSYAAFHGHLLALTVVIAAGNAFDPGHQANMDAQTLAHKSSQAATMVLTPPIERASAPYDAFKGTLLALGVSDASGNVVVKCRRSFGWGCDLSKRGAIFGCQVVSGQDWRLGCGDNENETKGNTKELAEKE